MRCSISGARARDERCRREDEGERFNLGKKIDSLSNLSGEVTTAHAIH